MSKHYMQTAKPKEIAEASIATILRKLKAGSYRNAAFEEAERKLLALYLEQT